MFPKKKRVVTTDTRAALASHAMLPSKKSTSSLVVWFWRRGWVRR